jgi:hypothetical protein
MVHIGHCGGVTQRAARVLKWKIYDKPEAQVHQIQGRMRICERCEGQGRTDKEQYCEYKKNVFE